MVQKKLEEFFGDFPFRANWQLMRIDLCYAWKFETQDQAEVMLDILRSFNFGRKKKATYDTSVMYVGQSYSLKFYLKHPEFFRHDFKILRDLGHVDFAYRMLDVAKGVLRFEVTLRKPFLNYHFGKKKIYVKDLREEKLWSIIYQLFDRFMGGFNIKYKTKQQIKALLITAWGKKKGGRLNVFYSYFITEGKSACREIYASSTVWQYLREIKQAGVPLTYQELKVFDLDLTIPSRLVINPCGGTPGSPRTPKKLYISNTHKPYDISDKEVKLKGVNNI
jgi:II/X family phage/plasmid replication protein